MLFLVAGLLVTASVASASTADQSNHFVDMLFNDKIKAEAHGYNLNGISVPDFKFKIESTGLTNRDLKANFTNGYVKGLLTPKRSGECSPTAWISGNVTLSCRIDLSGVFVQYSSFVKGYNLAGSIKQIDVFVRVKDTFATFEATSFPNRPVALRTFYVDRLQTKVEKTDSLGLNDDRKNKFYEEIRKKAEGELFNVFYNQYSKALGNALSRTGVALPPV